MPVIVRLVNVVLAPVTEKLPPTLTLLPNEPVVALSDTPEMLPLMMFAFVSVVL